MFCFRPKIWSLDSQRVRVAGPHSHFLVPSLLHSLTLSLSHSLTLSLPHSLTESLSLSHSLTPSLPYFLAACPGRWTTLAASGNSEADLISPQLYSPLYGGGLGVSRASGASFLFLASLSPLSIASLSRLSLSPQPNASTFQTLNPEP